MILKKFLLHDSKITIVFLSNLNSTLHYRIKARDGINAQGAQCDGYVVRPFGNSYHMAYCNHILQKDLR